MSSYVGIHILRPSTGGRINAGEDGQQKTIFVGGEMRTRVSSQSVKYAIRNSSLWGANGHEMDIRSRQFVDVLAAEAPLSNRGSHEGTKVATLLLELLIGNTEEGRLAGSTLLSRAEIRALANLGDQDFETLLGIANMEPGKNRDKAVKDYLKSDGPRDYVKRFSHLASSPFQGLTGRMVTTTPQFTLPAAFHVNHAFSVGAGNAREKEDYFICSDDLGVAGDGASMIGYQSLTPGVLFYQYMFLDWGQLINNLTDKAAALSVTATLLQVIARSFPRGGISNHADSVSLPAFMLITVGSETYSMADAFHAPVRAQGAGFVGPAVAVFADHYLNLLDTWGITQYAGALTTDLVPVESLAPLQAAKESGKSIDIYARYTALTEKILELLR